ncbi:Hypothetical protein R9X50_00610400 [Acrodontium crateriforme]|uniref:Response regulatory domain-containing protein n=1 Tax=Acrodontium crateriforme TaxID=150365 RepID=A0AAQ3MD17_9PEZI|nr:Hypothetical protein R9X50_00610400 [Acrodontium crateriforme]
MMPPAVFRRFFLGRKHSTASSITSAPETPSSPSSALRIACLSSPSTPSSPYISPGRAFKPPLPNESTSASAADHDPELADHQSGPADADSDPRASKESLLSLSLDQKELSSSTEDVHVEDDDALGPLPVFPLERPTAEALSGADRTPEQTSAGSLPNTPPEHTHTPDLAPYAATPTRNLFAHSDTALDDINAGIKDTPKTSLVKREGLLDSSRDLAPPKSNECDHLVRNPQSQFEMPHRKVWVKRPGASATLVRIQEGDLVDDVRDMILKKYANSLGRTFDAPDMILRIVQRNDHGGPRAERLLGPEEDICRTIDAYYGGKQAVEEALVIDTPAKKTPRPSPHFSQYQNYLTGDDFRPLESGNDYFPPVAAMIPATIPQTSSSHESRSSHHPSVILADHHGNPRSMAVLTTGQVPPLPSPGGTRRHRSHRPTYQRTHTSSPTFVSHATNPATNAPALNSGHMVHRRPRLDSVASDHHSNGVPAAPPLPTPPAPEAAPTNKSGSTPPTPNGQTVHRNSRFKKPRRLTPDGKIIRSRHQHSTSTNSNSNITSTMLDGSVPPINVLIVEDNIINLRILQGLMKRLKVRWETAMNGQIAVDKWKQGGFHLVLMDIQMPIMNGLEATKAIRRLERDNGIGVFSSTESTPVDGDGNNGDDMVNSANEKEPSTSASSPEKSEKLPMAEEFFKSPVIIVALTASSLQSDRHEALAAGCNDFLTKPVDFIWLQRKVKEWGCMQALIDFDGWRKWKDYASKEEAGKTEEEKRIEREKEEKARIKMEKMAKLQEKQRAKRLEEEERRKQASMEATSSAAAGVDDSGEPSAAVQTAAAEAEVPVVAVNGEAATEEVV